MNNEQAKKVLDFLSGLRQGVAVWKLGASAGLNEAIAIMREEVAPQAPAEPLSDAEILDLWTRTPGGYTEDEVLRFSRALLERVK